MIEKELWKITNIYPSKTDIALSITSVIILYPFQFFIYVCIGMFRVRSVEFIKQGSLSTIEFFVPTHEGRFRYEISSANERNSNAGTREIDGIIFS